MLLYRVTLARALVRDDRPRASTESLHSAFMRHLSLRRAGPYREKKDRGQDSEVSAFCCTNGDSIVSSNATDTRLPSITARPTRAEKERFAVLASSRGMSESTLALIAIRSLLESNDPIEHGSASPSREPAVDRITIRLRPGDRRAINERAARRGIKASAYLAALVRAHVASNPPLTAEELSAYRQGVIVLAGLGRLLARISRDAAKGGGIPKELQEELSRTRAVIAALEKRTHDLALAALISWESGYG